MEHLKQIHYQKAQNNELNSVFALCTQTQYVYAVHYFMFFTNVKSIWWGDIHPCLKHEKKKNSRESRFPLESMIDYLSYNKIGDVILPSIRFRTTNAINFGLLKPVDYITEMENSMSVGEVWFVSNSWNLAI